MSDVFYACEHKKELGILGVQKRVNSPDEIRNWEVGSDSLGFVVEDFDGNPVAYNLAEYGYMTHKEYVDKFGDPDHEQRFG